MRYPPLPNLVQPILGHITKASVEVYRSNIGTDPKGKGGPNQKRGKPISPHNRNIKFGEGLYLKNARKQQGQRKTWQHREIHAFRPVQFRSLVHQPEGSVLGEREWKKTSVTVRIGLREASSRPTRVSLKGSMSACTREGARGGPEGRGKD